MDEEEEEESLVDGNLRLGQFRGLPWRLLRMRDGEGKGLVIRGLVLEVVEWEGHDRGLCRDPYPWAVFDWKWRRGCLDRENV